MRICVPTTTDTGLAAAVSEHFGGAAYFTICDSQIPSEWVDGCFGRARPKWDVEIPVPVEVATWGQVKQQYE